MRKKVGLLCLVTGGLAWPVGYAMEYEVTQILPVHLVFIFSGVALRGSHLLNLIKRKRNSQ